MSELGDYLGEMSRIRTSDAEIERLLSGAPGVVGEDLQALADFFAALSAGSELEDDAVAAYVTAAASSVGDHTAAPAVKLRRGWSPIPALRRRAATVTMAAAVFLGGTSGLAVAADGAKPGDALYGIDRALEAVGIGAGAEQERFHEAEALVAGGEVSRGLEHAAAALDEDESNDDGASQALLAAAARVADGGTAQSAATRDRITGLLAYLSDHVGDIDGAHVAVLARQIGGPENRPSVPPSAEAPGPPDHSPAEPPGSSDRAPGPPADVPADPPGLSDTKPGPPDDVPADPPGLSDSKPGRPDPPRNQP